MDGPGEDEACKSWFWELDARAKLLGIVAFVAATALLARMDLLIASVTVAVILAAASRVPPRILVKAYATALPFIVLASVSIFLFAGVDKGINMVIRTSACALALLVMANGTETFDLFDGMRRLGVPAILTSIIMLTHKFILLLSEELTRMTTARRARGLRPGQSLLDKYGLKVLSHTAGMVFVRSSARAERTYEGLKSRGFNGEIAPWRTASTRVLDACFVAVLTIASIALLTIQTGVVP